ncbi:MAG: PAS domain-containing protein [Ktedonobacteraceae bacterium]|nr:PAS domain-containing protein [Ktedonobacteraceae bacterium]
MNTENVWPPTPKSNDELASSRHPVGGVLQRVRTFWKALQIWLTTHTFVSSRQQGTETAGQQAYNSDIAEQVLVNKHNKRLILERASNEQYVTGTGRDLEAIFEAIADPVFIVDARAGIQRMNRAARELLAIPEGVSTGELNTYPRFFELYDERGHYLPKEDWPQAAVLAGGTLYGATAVDVVMRTHDGRELDLSVTEAPLGHLTLFYPNSSILAISRINFVMFFPYARNNQPDAFQEASEGKQHAFNFPAQPA